MKIPEKCADEQSSQIIGHVNGVYLFSFCIYKLLKLHLKYRDRTNEYIKLFQFGLHAFTTAYFK